MSDVYGSYPPAPASGVPGWAFEVGTFGPRTTSLATSTTGDGLVLWCMSLMPMTDITIALVAGQVQLTFSQFDGGTVAEVERRQVVGGVPGAWTVRGVSGLDAGDFAEASPGAGTWQYRMRTAGGDYEINPSRSAYSATVEITI